MGLVFINAVVLLKIIVVTTQPLRDHGDPTGEDITVCNLKVPLFDKPTLHLYSSLQILQLHQGCLKY